MTAQSEPTPGDAAATGQVTRSAAEVYEQFFVPALFGQWPARVCKAVGVRPGDDVLDVGCGTGVLARHAAQRLAGVGNVTGLDPNPGMLEVARRAPERITWVAGVAEALPFADEAFDRVLSQFVLMFVTDTEQAVHQLRRVTRAHGTVGVATWCQVEESPGYAAMIDLLDEVIGSSAAAALRAPFALGTEPELHTLLARAFDQIRIAKHPGEARFASLQAWLHTEIRGWTLADAISDENYERLLERAPAQLADFVTDDGTVRFPAPALIAVAHVQ